MIERVLAVGFIAVVLSVFFKQQKKEIAILITLVAIVAIFLLILKPLEAVITMLKEMADRADLGNEQLSVILKIIGIAYITSIGSAIAKDAGESAIASKIEIAGKLAIMFYTIPIAYALLNLILSVLP